MARSCCGSVLSHSVRINSSVTVVPPRRLIFASTFGHLCDRQQHQRQQHLAIASIATILHIKFIVAPRFWRSPWLNGSPNSPDRTCASIVSSQDIQPGRVQVAIAGIVKVNTILCWIVQVRQRHRLNRRPNTPTSHDYLLQSKLLWWLASNWCYWLPQLSRFSMAMVLLIAAESFAIRAVRSLFPTNCLINWQLALAPRPPTPVDVHFSRWCLATMASRFSST